MAIVDLMIAGAQKAGTSSLKAMVEQHPDVCGHTQLECDFFLDRSLNNWERYFERYYTRKARVVLAKQAFFTRSEASVSKLYAINPKAHIVFVLREPLSRVKSAYYMDRKHWIDFSIEKLAEAIDAQKMGRPNKLHNTLIRPGDYADVARRLMKYFPPEQIHWFTFEHLKDRPVWMCREIFNAVNIRDDVKILERKENSASDFRSLLFQRFIAGLNNHASVRKFKAQLPYETVATSRKLVDKLNRKPASRDAKPELSPQLQNKLKAYYDRSNEEFVSLTGFELPW